MAAWHASPRLFSQGFAGITQETDAVQAALAAPGQVLKRPHGRHTPYKVEPDAPQAPRLTARQKQKAAGAEKARRQKAAEAYRARAAAEKKEAKAQLAEIAREEAALRRRRQTLKRQLHAHG